MCVITHVNSLTDFSGTVRVVSVNFSFSIGTMDVKVKSKLLPVSPAN